MNSQVFRPILQNITLPRSNTSTPNKFKIIIALGIYLAIGLGSDEGFAQNVTAKESMNEKMDYGQPWKLNTGYFCADVSRSGYSLARIFLSDGTIWQQEAEIGGDRALSAYIGRWSVTQGGGGDAFHVQQIYAMRAASPSGYWINLSDVWVLDYNTSKWREISWGAEIATINGDKIVVTDGDKKLFYQCTEVSSDVSKRMVTRAADTLLILNSNKKTWAQQALSEAPRARTETFKVREQADKMIDAVRESSNAQCRAAANSFRRAFRKYDEAMDNAMRWEQRGGGKISANMWEAFGGNYRVVVRWFTQAQCG